VLRPGRKGGGTREAAAAAPLARLAALAVAAVALALVLAAASRATGLTSTEASFLRAVNATRSAHGLGPVQVDGRLERAARLHTREMLAQDRFGHGRWWQRLVRLGAPGPTFGENLGWATESSSPVERIIRLWLESPEHRAVLLYPGYSRVGIGVESGRFQGLDAVAVVTADFEGR
jgi:uncharacterized protein YkwD